MTRTHRITSLVLCCLGLAAFEARAETVFGVHVASAHLPDNGRVSNVNPGAYVSFDNCATVGFYRNSLRRVSVYAGCTLERGIAGVTLGGVTGYEKAHGGHSNSPFAPLLALHLKSPVSFMGVTPRLTYIPGHLVKSADVFHISASWSIK